MRAKVDDFETLSDQDADVDGGPPKKGPSLKARAIAILSRRENSRLELQRKLAAYARSDDELEQLLNDLERENWLSNERFAQSLVNRRATRQGTSRIVQELRQHGLNDESIAGISQQLRGTEIDRARVVWEKKFGSAPVNAKEYAKQFRFLASRGFSAECLRRILGDDPHNF